MIQVVLTTAQKARIRDLCRICQQRQEYGPLYGYINNLLASRTPLEQLSPQVRADGERVHLGWWHRIIGRGDA